MNLNQPVDATKPITTIFRQIKNCQKKAIASGAPFTDEQILKAVEILLVATGLYNTKYRDWLSQNHADCTYANLKVEFTARYALQNELNMTTAQAGYHNANAAIDNAADISP